MKLKFIRYLDPSSSDTGLEILDLFGAMDARTIPDEEQLLNCVAPCASNSGSDSSTSGVSFGVTPFRGRPCND